MAASQNDRLLQGHTQGAAAMEERSQLSASSDFLKRIAFRSTFF